MKFSGGHLDPREAQRLLDVIRKVRDYELRLADHV